MGDAADEKSRAGVGLIILQSRYKGSRGASGAKLVISEKWTQADAGPSGRQRGKAAICEKMDSGSERKPEGNE